jgi:hypothetical protein
MSAMALWLKVDAADVVFLAVATVVALVVVLLSNPLTSWVNRLINKDKGE